MSFNQKWVHWRRFINRSILFVRSRLVSVKKTHWSGWSNGKWCVRNINGSLPLCRTKTNEFERLTVKETERSWHDSSEAVCPLLLRTEKASFTRSFVHPRVPLNFGRDFSVWMRSQPLLGVRNPLICVPTRSSADGPLSEVGLYHLLRDSECVHVGREGSSSGLLVIVTAL